MGGDFTVGTDGTPSLSIAALGSRWSSCGGGPIYDDAAPKPK